MLYASRFLRIMDPLMVGPDVKAVQDNLALIQLYKGKIDGIYGTATAEAVKTFQASIGITADGIVGPETWNALGLSIGPIPIKREYRIVIDTQRLILSLSRNGAPQAEYPVAVGKPNTPSPIGDWIIIDKQVGWGDGFGVRWMRLNVPWGGYGIHGTDNPSSIGTPASHGCIRMHNEDVVKLYDVVPMGTPVKITGQVYTGRILQVGVPPGSDVAAVQQRLQVLGFYQGDIDGVYGNRTREAVIAFQTSRQLTADGIVGPATYEELEKSYDIVMGLRSP